MAREIAFLRWALPFMAERAVRDELVAHVDACVPAVRAT